MTKEEITEIFNYRELNSKTNNMIIIGTDSRDLVESLPDTTGISFLENNITIDTAINIKIDLTEINVKDILTYVLNYLKDLKLVDVSLDYTLPLTNIYDINIFITVLHNYNIVVQLIFYNMEYLSEEEQKLLNELYYNNSSYFNTISLTKKGFITYHLDYNRVLKPTEHYQEYVIIKNHILTKEDSAKYGCCCITLSNIRNKK